MSHSVPGFCVSFWTRHLSVELNRSTIPSVCGWYGEVRIRPIPTVAQNFSTVLDMKLGQYCVSCWVFEGVGFWPLGNAIHYYQDKLVSGLRSSQWAKYIHSHPLERLVAGWQGVEGSFGHHRWARPLADRTRPAQLLHVLCQPQPVISCCIIARVRSRPKCPATGVLCARLRTLLLAAWGTMIRPHLVRCIQQEFFLPEVDSVGVACLAPDLLQWRVLPLS